MRMLIRLAPFLVGATGALAAEPVPINEIVRDFGPCEHTAHLEGMPEIVISAERDAQQVCRVTESSADGKAFDPEGGPAALVEPASLEGSDLEALLMWWTRDVLHGYDHKPSGAAILKKGKNWVVTQTVIQADVARPQHANRVKVTATYDSNGKLLSHEQEVAETWRLAFYTKAHQVASGVDEAAVLAAMKKKGLLFKRCHQAAFLADPTLQDFSRISFEISKGKATKLSTSSEGRQDLLQCYADAMIRVPFPADLAGSVTWSLVIRKTDPKPLP